MIYLKRDREGAGWVTMIYYIGWRGWHVGGLYTLIILCRIRRLMLASNKCAKIDTELSTYLQLNYVLFIVLMTMIS